MRTKKIIVGVFLSILLIPVVVTAQNYAIYSISQDIPMGFENEIIKKNFYVNVGLEQGLRQGTILDIFRNVTKVDPFDTQKRYRHLIKIGTLEVVHAETGSAITFFKDTEKKNSSLVLDIQGPMIGDLVNVNLD